MSNSEAVAAIEDRRLAAMCAGDTATLANLLGDRLVYTHSNARREDAAECVRLIETGHRKYERMQVLERDVVDYGSFAVTAGILDSLVHVAGTLKQTTVRYLGTYEHRADGSWILVGWQTTAISAS